MRYAFLAVFGPEDAETNGMGETIANHAIAYDNNPGAWEENRELALGYAGPENQEYVEIAKGLEAMESMNKDILEPGGSKLEYARRSDGSLGMTYTKVSDDE